MNNNTFDAGDVPVFTRPPMPVYRSTAFDKMIIVGAVAGALTFAQPDYKLLPFSNEKGDVEQVYAIADCLSQLKTTFQKWEERSATNEQTKKENLVRDLVSQIFSFRSLDNNWDGYDAIPVSALAASATTTVIRLLSEESLEQLQDIFPNTNGTISLKWSNLFDEKVSLCVGAYDMSYYVAKLQHEVAFIDAVEISADSISALDNEIQSIVSVNV